MRKWIAFLLALLLLAGSASALAAETEGYADVAAGAWYAPCVADVTERGLMNGVGGGLFDPEGTLTRAMLVTTLWRMNGCPAPAEESPFTDVPAGTWFTDAVVWAAENKVVEGIGDGLFDPDSPVTREQMAAIFYRWAKGAGLDVSTEETELARQQGASDWAVDAVNWAIPRHLLTKVFRGGLPHGASGWFYDVCSYAARAEVAVLLSRFSAQYPEDCPDRSPVTVKACGLENGSCDLLIVSPGEAEGQEKRLALYTFSDARVGNHFYAEPAADGAEVEGRPAYRDLPRTYDREGRLTSIERDGTPVYAVVYDEQGRVAELTVEQSVHYRVLYAPWGDPLFVEVENTAAGASTVFAFRYGERDGRSVLTGWSEDGKGSYGF